MIARRIWSAWSYLDYLLKARSRFKVHSPFVYELYTNVILDRKPRDLYHIPEKRRSSLRKKRSLLETTDFGSATKSGEYKIKFRQLRSIAKRSSVRRKYGQLLHRLAEHSNATEILEIGTALGISSIYISTAVPNSRITTIEGCAMISEVAEKNFRKAGTNNVELVVGNFDIHLEKVLENINKLDFAFLDGNHKKEATLNYFEKIQSKCHADSILVIDDIHWSRGMQQAWEEIKKNEKVSITIDLFQLGIVLFKEDIAKENFVLRY